MTEWYAVLGITRHSTEDDVRKNYKVLCRKHHPDNGGSIDEFDKIQKAFEKFKELGLPKFETEVLHLTHVSLFNFKKVS